MKPPIARPVSPLPLHQGTPVRSPRAFAAESVADVSETDFDFSQIEETPYAPHIKTMGWLGRLAWGACSLLVSLGLALAAERLIRDLFARYDWLGWVGFAALAAFVSALAAIAAREIWSLRRLRSLDKLKSRAAEILVSENRREAELIFIELMAIYAARPDLARARQAAHQNRDAAFDASELIRMSERILVAPLDARAKALTAASARRVALVTTVSPKALVDIAFVAYESVRLAGAIAALYGAKPGFFGFWRLARAVLGHLAVTGGLVLTDGLVEQLVGQGLAAKLSARLGEGVVNGLMTVRVGIAAMRVVRPLPFETQKQPMVKDFMADLANLR